MDTEVGVVFYAAKLLNGHAIPPQVVLTSWTPGITPREATLPAIRAVIIPDGEPDGILLRSIVVARIVVVSIGVTRIVVVHGHAKIVPLDPCPLRSQLNNLPQADQE